MGGIYIHIPFCKQACTYCNFHFSTSLKLKGDLIKALTKEIDSYNGFFNEEKVETIYLGGGTPSLLEEVELKQILNSVYANFNINPGAEVTLEANPDDITLDKLRVFREHGVNRLSIGIQSFFDDDLEFMNRAHNSNEAYACLEIATKAGIDNVNIDLIYGTPTLTDEKWLDNLDKVISLGIPHLSAYQLTVEPGTALASHIKKGKIPPLPEENAVRQFELLTQWAEQNGFDHYEISNLSLPGKRSRHNTSYWQGKPYLGVGPAAHSYKDHRRSWNIANNAIYIRKIDAGESAVEAAESLSTDDIYNEYIMTGLRRSEGIDLRNVKQFGDRYTTFFKEGIQTHVQNGDAELINNNIFRLTRSGKIFADRIASDCFAV